MIKQPTFSVEPWCLRETTLNLDMLAQAESVFALSNGHLGWRGNLDEGEPHGLPGTYLNGVYERRPLPYAEASYGLPETGETVINVTNGKLIRLFVDDEPFDVRYGELRAHERLLDFRTGVLTRHAEWISPAGGAVRVSSTRLVSFTQRAIAAIRYEVEPLEQPARIALQSELLTNEQLPTAGGDPRLGAVLDRPLEEEYQGAHEKAVLLLHRTRLSGLRVGAAMDHLIEGPDVHVESRVFPDGGVTTATAVVRPGQRLQLTKFVAYGWSGARSLPAVRDQVWAALSGARQTGWDGLLADQRGYLDDFWHGADVEIDGDCRRPWSGRPSSGSRAQPSRGGRSPARSARATGRPAPPPSTSTRTSPTRSSATSTRPATRRSTAGWGWICSRRPRGCGAPWATTTPTAGSTSTA
jgi:alpha,alpha-trehalose phosphorylase